MLIEGFYPCAVNDDEYLVLSNCGPETVNLLDWAVSDGEGAIRFLEGTLMPGCSLSLSENASSYAAAYGVAPDVHIAGWSSGDYVEVSGRFRLADSGDTIELTSPDGDATDAVVYGDALAPATGWFGGAIPVLRQGEVVRRLSSGDVIDTNSSDDWMHFREFRYGHTGHGVISQVVPPGAVTCFASPDCSLESVLGVISGATTSVRLCAYEMSSSQVCDGLLDAMSRGVDVHVLVDALPVGGMSSSQVACISSLARAGVDIRVLGGDLDGGVVRHVGALHAKYIVADEETLVALSENFVEDGVPSDRLFGNRGWGVSVANRSIASFMARVFDDDSREDRTDIWPWLEDRRYDPGAAIPEAEASEHSEGMLQPVTSMSGAEISLFISPDASVEEAFLAELITGATDVVFEQFQAEPSWTTRWSDEPTLSPVLGAVGEVLAGGGKAMGLFDGSWYNIDDNGDAVSYLSAAALASGAPPSFALLTNESPITVMHNKGLVLDESSVVSSNNWVYSSFARNRELAVVVRSEEVSSYFRGAFRLDWVPDTSAPVADAGPDVSMAAPAAVMLNASGSRDDRAIANMSWDLDCDGHVDAYGPHVSFEPECLGTFTVRLEVEDAWGNTASDTVVIIVGRSGTGGLDVDGTGLGALWPLPAAVSAVLALLVAARKLNLLRQSTRGKG